MKQTITAVYPQPRAWGKDYPDNCSIIVQFADGSQGDVGTKNENAESVKEVLTKLIGQEHEFGIKGEPREYQGMLTYKVNDYPGKTGGQGKGGFGGGGGRQYTPAWANTEEGERFVQERTDRRTALMQAVTLAEHDHEAPLTAEATITIANTLYAWLQGSVKAAQTPAPAGRQSTPSPAQVASPQATTAQNAPVAQEHAPNPRGKFFALWQELALPDNAAYQRYVIKRILLKVGAWPADVPLTTRTQLGEALWGIAAGGLKSYSTALVRNGVHPMQEKDFDEETEG